MQEGERRIPIVVEAEAGGSSRSSQLSDSGSSSAGSCEVPRLAEITRLPRLAVQIPIQRQQQQLDSGAELAAADTEGEGGGAVLDAVDVSEHLVYGEQQPACNSNNNNNSNNNSSNNRGGGKSSVIGSGSVELRAGRVDALIVLATQTIKNDFLYQEAFLATYRTFIKTETLVDKLVHRFTRFSTKSQHEAGRRGGALRISRNAFSLLVR